MHILLANTQLIDLDAPRAHANLAIDTRTGQFIDPQHTRKPQLIDLRDYMVFPGLINAHDHLELNHYPRTKFRDVYNNAHTWGEDISVRLATSPFLELQAHPLRDRCLSGGLKNILSGVTTVAHHNPLHRPLKSRQFPVHVIHNYGWAHSLHFADVDTIQAEYARSAPHPFMIHLAEGTDKAARTELSQLDKLGCLSERTVLIHGVGLTAEDAQVAIEKGASLVWCPSTNQYLLGTTADVRPWFEASRLMLGSDSRLTADGDLLDELRAAHATGQLSSEELFQIVTSTPTKLLNLPDRGHLQAGHQADLLILPKHANPYEALINTHRADISLIMRKGNIMVGDVDLVEQFKHGKFQSAEIDGRPKLLNHQLGRQIKKSQIEEVGLKLTS